MVSLLRGRRNERERAFQSWQKLDFNGRDVPGVNPGPINFGAPFVGAIAASFVVSEVLQLLHGGQLHRPG